MSKEAHRLGDVNIGEGPVINTSPNTTVFINGKLASVDNSQVGTPTGGLTANGSKTVFAHNTPINFIGNLDTTGLLRAEGSTNVFVDNAGVSYLRDNTLNFRRAPPEGMQLFTSPFVQYIFEHDDTESADPVGIQAPGITAEEYPIPDVIEENLIPPPPITILPTPNCSAVDVLPIDFDWNTLSLTYENWASSFFLSPNFTVYDLTVGPAVSSWILTDNVGLTQKEILQNLCYLANVVLEPMLIHFPDMIITSGFRAKSGTSQHNKGQACDIQIPGFSSQQYWDGALWIKQEVQFDQYVLEYGGNNPWYHISTNNVAMRQQVLTFKGTGVYVNGLVRVI